MSTSFRRPTQVIRRNQGAFVDGHYVAAELPAPVTILMGVQPVAADDTLLADAGGRRASEMRIGYTSLADALRPAVQDGHPGDLVYRDGDPWLVIGVAMRDVLMTGTSHARHLLVRHDDEVEGQPV